MSVGTPATAPRRAEQLSFQFIKPRPIFKVVPTPLPERLPIWRIRLGLAARSLDWSKLHATDEQLISPISAHLCESCAKPAQVSGYGQTRIDRRTRYVELCHLCAAKARGPSLLVSNLPGREVWEDLLDEAPDTTRRVKPKPNLDALDRERMLDVNLLFLNALFPRTAYYPYATTR